MARSEPYSEPAVPAAKLGQDVKAGHKMTKGKFPVGETQVDHYSCEKCGYGTFNEAQAIEHEQAPI